MNYFKIVLFHKTGCTAIWSQLKLFLKWGLQSFFIAAAYLFPKDSEFVLYSWPTAKVTTMAYQHKHFSYNNLKRSKLKSKA